MGGQSIPEGASEGPDTLGEIIIQGQIKGRGIAKFIFPNDQCLCQRPYSHILCLNCGHLMFGRVRLRCPQHLMVTFLIDITNCPKCRCCEFQLSEFEIQGEIEKN